MIADVSAIGKHRTGVAKDGAYAALLSLTYKASTSAALLLSGFILGWIGFVAGSDSQSHDAIQKLASTTFLRRFSSMSFVAIQSWRRAVERSNDTSHSVQSILTFCGMIGFG